MTLRTPYDTTLRTPWPHTYTCAFYPDLGVRSQCVYYTRAVFIRHALLFSRKRILVVCTPIAAVPASPFSVSYTRSYLFKFIYPPPPRQSSVPRRPGTAIYAACLRVPTTTATTTRRQSRTRGPGTVGGTRARRRPVKRRQECTFLVESEHCGVEIPVKKE